MGSDEARRIIATLHTATCQHREEIGLQQLESDSELSEPNPQVLEYGFDKASVEVAKT